MSGRGVARPAAPALLHEHHSSTHQLRPVPLFWRASATKEGHILINSLNEMVYVWEKGKTRTFLGSLSRLRILGHKF